MVIVIIERFLSHDHLADVSTGDSGRDSDHTVAPI
jgi:hypothetical protein